MEEHTIVMDSWRTSDSTLTLREFRSLGIHDGYKYVPKAHEIKPPFLKKVKLRSRNMHLSIITDNELFREFHKLDSMDGDCAVEQLESLMVVEEEEVEIISIGSSETSTASEDASLEAISLKSDSDCESIECIPDIPGVSQEYFPQIKFYSSHEYSLDKVTEDATMTDLSQQNNSDGDSMECNPDLQSLEYFPQVKLYNSDMQSKSLWYSINMEHNYSLNEYNPWKPEM